MKSDVQNTNRRRWPGWLAAALCGGLLTLATLRAFPNALHLLAGTTTIAALGAGKHGEEDTPTGHGPHELQLHLAEPDVVELSAAAWKNIGLEVERVELRGYDRTIKVPAVIVDRPGWSSISVAAPLTAAVTRIHVLQGEAVEPGAPLFDLHLTHEELVAVQSSLLRSLGELDVVRREIDRLSELAEQGAVPGRTLLAQQYEEQKLLAAIKANREALLLHGLQEEQVDQIAEGRTLFSDIVVRAPQPQRGPDASPNTGVLYVEELAVSVGQHVELGETLCRLGDHGELYIEGRAFEHEAALIGRADAEQLPVTATLIADGQATERISDLEVLYVDNNVEPQSRAQRVYVALHNEIVRDTTVDGHRFITWRFRPGQRLQLEITVERLEDRIVLPASAIVREGAEAYVFLRDGDHFHRRPVHVEHRDQHAVVIANDGAVFAGETVAATAADQLHLAIERKNTPATGHDHHGHSH